MSILGDWFDPCKNRTGFRVSASNVWPSCTTMQKSNGAWEIYILMQILSLLMDVFIWKLTKQYK